MRFVPNFYFCPGWCDQPLDPPQAMAWPVVCVATPKMMNFDGAGAPAEAPARQAMAASGQSPTQRKLDKLFAVV